MGQLVLSVGGAIAGFFVGGPEGAAIGYELGSLAGQAAFPSKVNGPSLPPTFAQRSNYGAMLPIGFGAFRVGCNLIWEAGFYSGTTNSGGKGGPTTVNTTWYCTFAVSICDTSNTGPILGIRRLWMNGQIVYDVSSGASAASLAASQIFAESYMTVYTGTSTQTPDPVMVGTLGAGNVPAYRNTAYIVFEGLPLTQFSNALPTVNAEIVTVGGGGGMHQVFEAAVTTPTYATAASHTNPTDLWPIITAITPTIQIVDRSNYATTQAQLFGDGNVYSYNASTGAYAGSALENPYQLAFAARSQHNVNPTYPVLGANAGNGGVGAVNAWTVIAKTGSASGFASNSFGGALVVQNWNSGSPSVVCDLMPACVGVPSGFYLVGFIPCSDGEHVLLLTKNATNSPPILWNLINFASGSAVNVSSGTVGTTFFGDYFGNLVFFSGDYSDSDPDDTGEPKYCLDSDLNTIWGITTALNLYGLVALSLNGNGGSISLNTAVTQAFPVNFPTGGNTGPAAIWAYGGQCAIVKGNYLTMWSLNQIGNIVKTNVGAICSVLAESVGIPSGNIDVSSVTSVPAWGMLIERQATLRDVMNSIAPTFFFDMVESDQKVSFRSRSATPVATINVEDMGAVASEKPNDKPLTITRADDLSLPYHVDVAYYNVGASYQVGTQYAQRITTNSTNRVSISAAAVMGDQDAVNAAAVILWDAWAGRLAFEFSTTLKWGQVECTDIVTLVNDKATNAAGDVITQTYLARITSKQEQGEVIKWTAVGCAPIYNQNLSPGIITPAAQSVSSTGATTLVLLDLPPLRDQDGNSGTPLIYVGMYGQDTGWPGANLFKSLDGGATWSQQTTSTQQTVIGTTANALGNYSGPNNFDEGSTVTVNLITPGATLAGATYAAVQNGANLCLIGNELCQFRNATMVSSTQYTLSGFLRGRIDTEVAQTGHGVGEQFVLLTTSTGAYSPINIQDESTSDLNVQRDYMAVTLNQPLSSGVPIIETSQGENLICFYPAYPLAVASPGTNDILLSWVRRNRITWQWLENTDVPMSESPSNANGDYAVSIYNGSTVVRTITVTNAQNVTYTSAQQIADFGSNQTTLKWGVAQISAITGAGKQTITTSTPV